MGYYSEALHNCLVLIEKGVPRLLREQACHKRKPQPKKKKRAVKLPVPQTTILPAT